MAVRTYLFVPGDSRRMLAKATERGAGAVIADLEDAVGPAGKEAGRAAVGEWLAEVAGAAVERWVRVNPAPLMEAEVAACAGASLTGVFVPKINGPADVAAAIRALNAAGLTAAAVVPIVETASALASVHEVAAAPRVHQLMLGDIDLGADLGMAPHSAGWTAIRVQLVVASAAAGIAGPIGPVDTDFTDLDRIERETRELYDLGYRSRPAIHPAQVAPYEAGLAPTDAEVAWARELLAGWDPDIGVGVDAAGHMIDEAVLKRARRILHESG